MDNESKPKKALRNLFTKTENLAEEAPLNNLTSSVQINRQVWQEKDYIAYLKQIDQAQTGAFFLKGKLVAEIKDKFYRDNKKGWGNFCEQILNLNYTTANQYIRVAQEFDVTAHQRPDFGFEHFKALLPLPLSEREELIQIAPKDLSVKNLRDMITKKISPSNPKPEASNKINSKQIISTLQTLKEQLSHLKNAELSQEDRWQLYGAFQNLCQNMNTISMKLIATKQIEEIPTQDP